MSLLGLYLTVLIGPTVPVPMPVDLAQALKSVEVTHNDEGRSGFQITFWEGRAGVLGLSNFTLSKHPLLQPFNRVVLVVTFQATPTVLMDGIITHQQLMPGSAPDTSTLAVTGEDVSVMMDLIQRKVEHPPLTEEALVTMIMARYAQYGVVPLTMPPPSLRQPSLTYKPFQDGTDLAYVRQLAQRYAYVFCVIPGPVPGMNQAYWGPRIRPGIPQAALSVDLGPTTNVESINFQYNALSPVKVVAWLQDRDTNALRKLTASSSKLMTLSAEPALSKLRYVREVTLKTVVQDDDPWQSVEGLTYAEALALVQARIDTSMRHVVVAQGELDTLRYGHVLEARKLVGLRGAGSSYDGTYYVQSVTHALRLGAYKQSFTLTREGVGTATPLVRP